MKKIIYSLFIGFTSLTVNANSIFAQKSTMPIMHGFKADLRQLDAMENPAGAYIPDSKDVNVKATKDFQTRFVNVSNAKWFSTNEGFEAFFVQAGFGNRVYYNKKGKWTLSVILCDESKLPHDLRAEIRSTYYDMSISQVEEFQNPDHSVYIVTLQDKSSIIVLKITQEGEMNVLQDLKKG
jgi:hypothetical protein